MNRFRIRPRALLALLLAALLAGCAAKPPSEVKSRATSYTNPVYIGTKDGLGEAPDPGVVKFNGEYYTYVTGDPCQVLKSEDMVNWKLVGPMIPENDNCWAPDVVYKDGSFYAYLSTVKRGYAEQGRRVKLYTADNPAGPFTFQAVVTKNYSYDAGYFQDQGGNQYLYWTEECASLNIKGCTGNSTVVDRLVDMKSLAGEQTLVAGPEGWECKGRCILEAPSVTAREGQFYLLYSGGAYENPTYGQGYARANQPLIPKGATGEAWRKQNQVLASIEAKVDGPGGASWAKAPNNLDDWLIYHARGINRTDWDRWLRIDPVMWGRGRFWVPGGASYTAQPGPAMPRFRDLFNRPDSQGLGQGWSASGGTWAVAGGAARQTSAAGAARALTDEAAAHYLFEANVRWVAWATASGAGAAGAAPTGQAGVIAYWADEQNHVTALLDPVTRSLTVTTMVGGKAEEPRLFALPEPFPFEAYHQLLVRKNGPALTIAVDGRPLGSLSVPFPAPGKAGLATTGAAAEFDGIAFTEGWEDFFVADDLTWAAPQGGAPSTGDWAISGGVLAQRTQNAQAALIKTGSRNWKSYEVTATLRATADGWVGLYAAYADSQNNVRVLLDPLNRKLLVLPTLKGKGAPEVSVLLDPLFTEPLDLKLFHTLQVIKDGFTFTVYLDGRLVTQQQIQLPEGQPGLVTQVSAEFDSVRAVRRD